jgi:hypothetical protein
VGVPVGGTAGQFLTKTTTGVDYATGWTTLSLSDYLTKANNLSDLTNFSLARDNLSLGTLNTPTFVGVTAQGSGANVGQFTSTALTLNHTGYGQFVIQPSTGITFPDASVQTTAFPAGSDVPTGGLTGQALVKLSNSNYDADWATISSDYITSVSSPLSVTTGDLSIDLASYATESWVTSQGYATESWVTSQGYLTTAILDGYALLSGASFSGSCDFINGLSSSGTVTFQDNGHLDASGVDLDGRFRIRFGPFSGGASNVAWGDFGFNGTYLVYGNGQNQTETVASQTWVKAGVTFTGKVNMAAPTAGSASLNLGVGTAPTTSVAGDIWIATNINYRDATGTQKAVANTNTSNTYTAPQIIQTPVGTVNAALRVTQLGTGNALLVEDQNTPDTSALVVDASGNVGVGVATGYTSTSKLEVVGNVKGTTLSTASGPAFSLDSIVAHTGGSDTNDLLVTIGGVNYRIGMRIV